MGLLTSNLKCQKSTQRGVEGLLAVLVDDASKVARTLDWLRVRGVVRGLVRGAVWGWGGENGL